MVETPVAVLHAEEIARASDRLACLVLGTNDLYKELGATFAPGRAAIQTSLQLAVLAARAAGVTVLDGVFNDVKDADGFLAEARQGRELGFDGKTLIHPGQVEPCNEVFAPSAAQVEEAEAVIAAFEAAQAEGRGVATLGGRLIENLHVDTARKVLATAEAIAALS
jgi:citrate lyase subunit beta/citryl-CoA lyase